MHRLRFVVIFWRMRYLLVLSVALPAIFLVVGCGRGGSQGEQEDHHAHHHGSSATLALPPEGDSGVSGTASFKNSSDGVVVKLELSGLPKPGTLYLAHIHPGTCAQAGEEEGESHVEHHEHGEHAEEGEDHEHLEEGHAEHGEEIEYPLSQVKSNSEGEGSSTTTLQQTSVEKLFSGAPTYVNVHEVGAGDPPVLTCADLKRAG